MAEDQPRTDPMRKPGYALALSVLLLTACAEKEAPPRAALGSFGVELAAMDPTVEPGADFYRYVNGKWQAAFENPDASTDYVPPKELAERTEADLFHLLAVLVSSDQPAGSVARKVSDIYLGWMDEDGIERRGLAPIRPFLAQIDAVSDQTALQALMASVGFAAPFELEVKTDPADPSRYCVWISQEGLGMPDRDYYLNTAQEYAAYREAYEKYVTHLFELIGSPDPAVAAATVIDIETRIAKVHWTQARSRDMRESINPMDRVQLAQLVPSIDWDVVLTAAQLDKAERFIVSETTAIRDAAKLLDAIALADWKTYLTFHFVDGHAYSLPKAFDEAQFEFHRAALYGDQWRKRWQRGITLLNNTIGEGLGQLYVEQHFPASHKAKMEELVANLRATLLARIESLRWMDEATRAAAVRKLATLEVRIGYPDQWRDYAELVTDPSKHFETMHAIDVFQWREEAARLTRPVDRSEWGLSPQSLNGSYNTLLNQITFPAAILQPPYFDSHADPAVNYGAIGSFIAHEMTHGFDARGRELDGEGQRRNWWTPSSNDRFVAITDALAAQYAQYCPLPDQCVNATLTSSENVADLSGVELALAAYQRALGGQPAPVIDGFTGEQRFFIAYTSSRRGQVYEDQLREQLRTSPKAPPQARGQFPLRNIDAWYAAFNVGPGDPLYIRSADRVHIWQ